MRLTSERAVCRAGIASIVAVTVLTIAAELLPPVRGLLVRLASHHWIAKSAAALIVFALVLVLGRRPQAATPARAGTVALTVVALVSSLALLLFYAIHHAVG